MKIKFLILTGLLFTSPPSFGQNTLVEVYPGRAQYIDLLNSMTFSALVIEHAKQDANVAKVCGKAWGKVVQNAIAESIPFVGEYFIANDDFTGNLQEGQQVLAHKYLGYYFWGFICEGVPLMNFTGTLLDHLGTSEKTDYPKEEAKACYYQTILTHEKNIGSTGSACYQALAKDADADMVHDRVATKLLANTPFGSPQMQDEVVVKPLEPVVTEKPHKRKNDGRGKTSLSTHSAVDTESSP